MRSEEALADKFAESLRRTTCANPHEAQPGIYVSCQSRRTAVCPSCASLHRGDWQKLARSGMYDADGRPVPGFRYFFITLSAPSFGAVHRVPKPWDDSKHRCRCGTVHTSADTELSGLPVNPASYDYDGQVRWHGALSSLWAASVDAMRRREDMLEYFVVREVQHRLALHVHAVVRVPSSSPVTASIMGDAARGVVAAHRATGEPMMWGQKGVKDREILPRRSREHGVPPDMSTAAARVISYVSKALNYSLKDVVPGQDSADSSATVERMDFVRRLREAARFRVRCKDCPEGGAVDCNKRAHESLGYGGHTVTMSRPVRERADNNDPGKERAELRPGWSFSKLTRKRLREERTAWAAANYPQEDRTGGIDEDAVYWGRYATNKRADRARKAWEAQQPAYAP